MGTRRAARRRPAKRPRTTTRDDAPPRAADSDSDSCQRQRDWGILTAGPAGLVAERALASDVADYIRFRAVCRADPRAGGGHGVLDRRFDPRHWTMLREKTPAAATTRRRFCNVCTGKSVRVDLPELDGHYVFGPTGEGLLLLVDKRTSVVRLLNPLTRHLAELPPLIPLLDPRDRYEWYLDSDGNLRQDFYRDIFRDLGAGLADDATIALHAFEPKIMLVVAKLGDERWTLLHEGKPFMSTISFGGRFYCATSRAVLVVETGVDEEENHGPAPPAPRLVVAAELAFGVSLMADTLHFGDDGRELMLLRHRFGSRRVLRSNSVVGNLRRVYDVHRVDMGARTTVLQRCGLERPPRRVLWQ